ncbi:hypothetical protein [Streptosporangium sp. NPDC000396]
MNMHILQYQIERLLDAHPAQLDAQIQRERAAGPRHRYGEL